MRTGESAHNATVPISSDSSPDDSVSPVEPQGASLLPQLPANQRFLKECHARSQFPSSSSQRITNSCLSSNPLVPRVLQVSGATGPAPMTNTESAIQGRTAAGIHNRLSQPLRDAQRIDDRAAQKPKVPYRLNNAPVDPPRRASKFSETFGASVPKLQKESSPIFDHSPCSSGNGAAPVPHALDRCPLKGEVPGPPDASAPGEMSGNMSIPASVKKRPSGRPSRFGPTPTKERQGQSNRLFNAARQSEVEQCVHKTDNNVSANVVGRNQPSQTESRQPLSTSPASDAPRQVTVSNSPSDGTAMRVFQKDPRLRHDDGKAYKAACTKSMRIFFYATNFTCRKKTKEEIERNTIFVSNLSDNVTERFLCSEMKDSGTILSAKIPSHNGERCGIARVTFGHSVQEALRRWHGRQFLGRTLTVVHDPSAEKFKRVLSEITSGKNKSYLERSNKNTPKTTPGGTPGQTSTPVPTPKFTPKPTPNNAREERDGAAKHDPKHEASKIPHSSRPPLSFGRSPRTLGSERDRSVARQSERAHQSPRFSGANTRWGWSSRYPKRPRGDFESYSRPYRGAGKDYREGSSHRPHREYRNTVREDDTYSKEYSEQRGNRNFSKRKCRTPPPPDSPRRRRSPRRHSPSPPSKRPRSDEFSREKRQRGTPTRRNNSPESLISVDAEQGYPALRIAGLPFHVTMADVTSFVARFGQSKATYREGPFWIVTFSSIGSRDFAKRGVESSFGSSRVKSIFYKPNLKTSELQDGHSDLADDIKDPRLQQDSKESDRVAEVDSDEESGGDELMEDDEFSDEEDEDEDCEVKFPGIDEYFTKDASALFQSVRRKIEPATTSPERASPSSDSAESEDCSRVDQSPLAVSSSPESTPGEDPMPTRVEETHPSTELVPEVDLGTSKSSDAVVENFDPLHLSKDADVDMEQQISKSLPLRRSVRLFVQDSIKTNIEQTATETKADIGSSSPKRNKYVSESFEAPGVSLERIEPSSIPLKLRIKKPSIETGHELDASHKVDAIHELDTSNDVDVSLEKVEYRDGAILRVAPQISTPKFVCDEGETCARTMGYVKQDGREKKRYIPSLSPKKAPFLGSFTLSNIDCKKNISSRHNRHEVRRFRKGVSNLSTKNDVVLLNCLSGRRKKVKCDTSRIHGMGLYADEDIESGELVAEYIGEVIRRGVADHREKMYERQGIGDSYLFRLSATHVLDATRKGCVARFINHSCEPNVIARIISVGGERRIVFYSKRDIRCGEEIVYDYKFDIEGEDLKIPCLCRSQSCRKYLN